MPCWSKRYSCYYLLKMLLILNSISPISILIKRESLIRRLTFGGPKQLSFKTKITCTCSLVKIECKFYVSKLTKT